MAPVLFSVFFFFFPRQFKRCHLLQYEYSVRSILNSACVNISWRKKNEGNEKKSDKQHEGKKKWNAAFLGTVPHDE